MPEPNPTRRGPRLLLKLIAAFSTAIAVTVFVLIAWSDYRARETAAKEELAGVVRLIEAHTQAALLSNSIQLERVEALIAGRRLELLRRSEADLKALRDILDDQPDADSFWIVDTRGDVVLSTDGLDVRLNVGDRPYFTEAMARPDEVFISPLLWGKLRGGYYFASSKALLDFTGSVMGVIQSSIEAGHFTEIYKDIHPGSGAAFVVVKSDGSVAMRWPLPGEAPFDETIGEAKRIQLPPGQAGIFRRVSPVDGIERLYAFRRIPGSDLAAIAGLPLDEVFEQWQERTIRTGVFTAATLGTLLLMTGFALRSAGALENALLEKETLFQEIHHRVKNNLQTVASLLTMQSLSTQDKAARTVLEEALNRVQTMGLIHHTLYQQNEASQVELAAYLKSLVERLREGQGGKAAGAVVRVDAVPVKLDLERVVPLALIANEAITNAFKHAFPEGKAGMITVSLARDGNTMTFRVTDNGIGMPREIGRGSLGVRLISSLAVQLNGRAGFSTPRGGGTELTVVFPA